MKQTLFAAVAAGVIALPASAQELTLWSHWADQQAKVDFVEGAARAFEEANPGVTINITWYQKEPLYAALKTALTAGQGPDIFYAETDQTEYMATGLILDLSNQLNWDAIEPWAQDVWGWEGGVYGFPLEAWTVETYVNQSMLDDMGIEMPVAGAEGQAFVDAVAKIAEADATPMAQGPLTEAAPSQQVERLQKRPGFPLNGKSAPLSAPVLPHRRPI